jgi:hypothetical protein
MAALAIVMLQVSMRGGTGLEWMTIASVLIPAVLIFVLVYLGDRFAPS